MLHKHHLLLLALLFVVFAPTAYFFSDDILKVFAQTPAITGYAWSSNIGWISLGEDGANPGLSITDGKLKGYAWSPNIGYIYFGGGAPSIGEIEDAPSLPKQWATLENVPDKTNVYIVRGWARACSVFQIGCSGSLRPNTETGGWDGWIKMSGDNADLGQITEVMDTINAADTKDLKFVGGGPNDYGVLIKSSPQSNKTFGYAWGGGAPSGEGPSPQFPGWIKFNIVPVDTALDFGTLPQGWVVFQNNITPAIAHQPDSTALPTVPVQPVIGTCLNEITVHVDRITDAGGTSIDSQYYDAPDVTITPDTVSPALTISFTRKGTDQPGSVLPALASGLYTVHVIGSTVGETCGQNFTGQMTIRITAPFTGGTYTEE